MRGGKVQPATWKRIIAAGAETHVWSGGIARLPGSGLIGGDSAIHVTGVAFHPEDIKRLARQQQPPPSAKRAVSPASPTRGSDGDAASTPKPIKKQQAPDLTALHSGALLLTVNLTMAALAIGRTKVYELINEGVLNRPDGGTRVTAGSVRKYAGQSDYSSHPRLGLSADADSSGIPHSTYTMGLEEQQAQQGRFPSSLAAT